MAVLSTILGVAGLSAINSFSDLFANTIDKTFSKALLARTIVENSSELVSAQRSIILGTYSKDNERVESAKEAARKSTESLQKELEQMRSLTVNAAERDLLSDLGAKSIEWQPAYEEVVRLCASGSPDAAIKFSKDTLIPIHQRIEAAANRLADQQSDSLIAVKSDVATVISRNRWITACILLLCLAVGTFILFIVHTIAADLRKAISELGESATQVAAAAGQVSSGSQAIAQGSSKQAASIEETSASTEEINSMARKNSENSRSAAELVGQSQQKFTLTNRALEEMVTAMSEITAGSDKISKIIRVIDEIAFQTNILALNAAVEAARAGEAGMGFAVVADEVRNLAQRSAQAAKDTAALIEDSIAKSNGGRHKVDEVARAIHAVTGEFSRIKVLVDEISLGSQEQAKGTDQIGRVITQIEQATQRSAASAQESAAVAEELTAQSSSLSEIVGRLAEIVGREEVLPNPRAASSKSQFSSRKPGTRLLHPAPVESKVFAPLQSAGRSEIPLEQDFKEF
jgi:methyl-accepting chemotaxis protein/methyl-accepting chemotaxis protein-1 (serine sensor receptor)